MIAVLGAAGNVGSKVCELLLSAGEEIKVLEHDRDLRQLRERGAEVVKGDAREVDDLRTLFAGAGAALVMLPEDVTDPSFVQNRLEMSRAIRDALRAEGVGHVVALSAVGAAHEGAPGPPGGLYIFEQNLKELDGVDLLVLRAAAYMDYLLAALPSIQAQGVNGSAIEAETRFPMVATGDVANEAADRLRKRDFEGLEIKLLLGPEDLTMTEITRAIGEKLGKPDLAYVQFPPDGVKAALLQAGMSEEVAGLLVEMQLAVNEGLYLEGVRRGAESSTPTRFEDLLNRYLPGSGTDVREGHR